MNKPKDSSEPKVAKFPLKMTCLTLIILAPIILAQLFPEAIREFMPAYESAFANLALFLATLLLIVLWSSWLLFFSRRSFLVSKVLPIGILISTATLMYLFIPIFNGSMGLAGFQFRYGRIKYEKMNVTGAKIKVDEVVDDKNFSQFLGPHRNGNITNIEINPDWDNNEPKVIWRKEIGKGWCGFAAQGNYAYTIEQRNEIEIVTCRDIVTGDIIWKHDREQRHEDAMNMGGVGPRSTPTIYKGQVFAQGGTGILLCLNAETGELVWEQDIPKLVGIEFDKKTRSNGVSYSIENSTLAWGRSASPLVLNDMVIIPAGGPANGKQVTLIAFSTKDGKEIWRGGNLAIGYGSPIAATLSGVEQVLLVTEDQAAGFSMDSGQLLWKHERPGHSNGDANSQQINVVGKNRLLLTKGYGLGGELISVEKVGTEWEVESIWKNQRVLQTKFTNAVTKGEYAYGISEKVLECVKIADGERIWRNVRVGHGQMLIVGNHILAQTERGDIVLVDARPEFENEIGRIRKAIKGVCWNTICIQDQYLLIRSDREAACIELPIKAKERQRPDPAKDDPARKDKAE